MKITCRWASLVVEWNNRKIERTRDSAPGRAPKSSWESWALGNTFSYAFIRMLTCGFCFSACVCMVCNASLHVYGSTWCVSVCVEARDLCPQNHSIAYIIKPELTSPAGELARLRALNYSQPPQLPGSPAPPPELSLQDLSSCVGVRYFRGFFPIKLVNIDCLL